MYRLGLAWALGLPLAILTLSTCLSSTLRAERYYSPCIGGFALVFYFGLAGWPRVKFRRLLLIVATALLSAYSLTYLFAKGDGVREAIAYLKENLQPDDALMLCQYGATLYAFTYYDVPVANIQGVDRDVHDTRELLDHARLATQGRPRRVWLFLYHEKKTPLFQVLVEHTSFFKLLQPQMEFREVKLSCFEALPAFLDDRPTTAGMTEGMVGR